MFAMLLALFLIHPSSASDVPRAVNGKRPVIDPVTFQLVPDLRITANDRDDAFIWAGFQIAVRVNDAGHMYVVDSGANRIVVLNKEGDLIRVIGREGKGPGEFQALHNLTIMNDQSLAAFDIRSPGSLHFFDRDGNFLSMKKLTADGFRNFKDACLSPDGRWLFARATGHYNADKVTSFEYAVFDAHTMKKVHSLLRFELADFDMSQQGNPSFWKKFLSDRIGVDAKGLLSYVTFAPDGSLYTALATQYEITRWSSKMEKSLVISREYKPIALPEKEIEVQTLPVFAQAKQQVPDEYKHIISMALIKDSVNMAGYPPVKNPVMGLQVMEDGTLMVIHDHNLINDRQSADLFDTKGRFMGTLTHEHGGLKRMYFKNGFAYTIENIDEENELVRYRIERVERN